MNIWAIQIPQKVVDIWLYTASKTASLYKSQRHRDRNQKQVITVAPMFRFTSENSLSPKIWQDASDSVVLYFIIAYSNVVQRKLRFVPQVAFTYCFLLVNTLMQHQPQPCKIYSIKHFPNNHAIKYVNCHTGSSKTCKEKIVIFMYKVRIATNVNKKCLEKRLNELRLKRVPLAVVYKTVSLC